MFKLFVMFFRSFPCHRRDIRFSIVCIHTGTGEVLTFTSIRKKPLKWAQLLSLCCTLTGEFSKVNLDFFLWLPHKTCTYKLQTGNLIFQPSNLHTFSCECMLNDPGWIWYRDQADLKNGKRMERYLKVCSILASVSLDILCHAAEAGCVRSNFARHKSSFFF